MIKIREEINKMETKTKPKQNKTIEQINQTRSWFFEKIKKIDKPLARLIRKREGEREGGREREGERETDREREKYNKKNQK